MSANAILCSCYTVFVWIIGVELERQHSLPLKELFVPSILGSTLMRFMKAIIPQQLVHQRCNIGLTKKGNTTTVTIVVYIHTVSFFNRSIMLFILK